jgi:hypothetical protein
MKKQSTGALRKSRIERGNHFGSAAASSSEPSAFAPIAQPAGTVPPSSGSSADALGANATAYIRPKRDRCEIPGQNYWVLSYVTPTGDHTRSRDIMVKNSGAFATVTEAEARAEQIRNEEPRLTVYVVNMYEFLVVPIPIIANEMLRKHYIDERLDAIMYAQHQAVLHSRTEMDRRMKQDSEAALAKMRKVKNDPNYTFAKPPDVVKKYEEEIKPKEQAETKYHAEDIIESMLETIRVNKGKPTDEQMVAQMLALLADKTSKKEAEQQATKEQRQREAEEGIAHTNAPAVSDNMMPAPPVEPAEFI